jgi:pilus assembly protein CpaE
MPELTVVIVATDNEQRAVLQVLVDGTTVARTVHTCASFPVAASDPVTRRVRTANPDVTLVNIPADNPQVALRAIELLHREMPEAAIFAIGNLNQPLIIVSAMRAGAREFIGRPTTADDLLESFARLTTAQRLGRQEGIRGKVFSIINAKGGSGATTVAVNLALALQSAYGQTALVDFAPIGHASLHLNLRPQFGILDALQNLHRIDPFLLDGLMTPTKEGLRLLAGPQQPYPTEPTPGELARLFDLLVNHYRFVIVDASSRLDHTTRLLSDLSNAVLVVAQTDVVSLWSAGRIHAFLEEGTGRDRLRMVLNRYKKIPGFTEEAVEQVTCCKVLWKIPNEFLAISSAINRGSPVIEHSRTEIARCFYGLAQELARNHADDTNDADNADHADNAPVGAPLKPKPHLRSGGAMAIPEPDDAKQTETTGPYRPQLEVSKWERKREQQGGLGV